MKIGKVFLGLGFGRLCSGSRSSDLKFSVIHRHEGRKARKILATRLRRSYYLSSNVDCEKRTPPLPQEQHLYANVNLKVTDEERWRFKEWCVRHRMSQVDAFRLAFRLLQDHATTLTLPTAAPVKEKNLE